MKVCMWVNITGALTGKTQGGGELQLSLLAKALAKADNEVVVIDYETPESFVSKDGIKILTIEGWHKGVRIVRTVTHRLPELYRSLLKGNAHIYYCLIRDFRHILAYWAAKKNEG